MRYLSLWWEGDKSVLPTLEYYVACQKAKATKAEPLSALVQKELLKSSLLTTKGGRDKFLSAWEHARKLRYVAKPKFGKKKPK